MKDFFISNRKRDIMVAGILGILLLSSCNKDDEITVEIPDDTTSDSNIPSDFEVIEYLPAPGQFINDKTSGFNGITTMDEACSYAEDRLKTFSYVSLGAWGGYLVVKSKTPVANTHGYDFSIAGNAFDTSNEPGIVWVMPDTNGNGLPDEEWYELKGSYYGKEGYEKGFSITYFRPKEGENDVRWIAGNGDTGVVKWLGSFHSQPYYPSWIKEDSYTLHGSLLPDRMTLIQETGIWTFPAFKWGYADNGGEDSAIFEIRGRKVQKNFFRISDAVDADGNLVELKTIDFIKVQTGVCGESEVIGENSTEICGFFLE